MTTLLILGTWLIWVTAVAGIGAGIMTWRRPHTAARETWHAGLWIGLGIVVVGASALQLLVGLGGSFGLLVATVVLIGGLGVGAWVAIRHWRLTRDRRVAVLAWKRLPTLLLLVLFGVGLIGMAYLATGEPMDADAGSYRIGAVLYAGEERVVPGLANIHFRFGFNSTLWPFAALVGTGLWEGLGYRVVTGVFVTAMLADVAIRLAIPRSVTTKPGDWFMVIATAFTGGIILTDAGRWIPSPGQDLAFLIVAVAAMALLADYVNSPASARWSGPLAVIVAATAASIRPLGWVLALATWFVVLLYASTASSRTWKSRWQLLRVSTLFFTVTAAVMGVRDLLLTGWILYPITAVPAPVPWLAASGEGASQGITAYGRAPGVDANVVLASNDWLVPWISGFLASREVFFLRFMVIGALLPLLWPRGRRAWHQVTRPLLWAISPPLLLTLTWFATAPDVRFGWAGLVGVAALPGAFLLATGAYPVMSAKVLAVVGLVLMMVTQVLNGRFMPRGGEAVPTEVSVAVWSGTVLLAPPPTPKAVQGELADGTPVQYPATGGNCYDIFPLCLIPGTGQDVRSLGDELVDGFGRVSSAR